MIQVRSQKNPRALQRVHFFHPNQLFILLISPLRIHLSSRHLFLQLVHLSSRRLPLLLIHLPTQHQFLQLAHRPIQHLILVYNPHLHQRKDRSHTRLDT